MNITYYDEHIILTPESQAEKMQIDTLFKYREMEKPHFSYELRNVPHSLILGMVK